MQPVNGHAYDPSGHMIADSPIAQSSATTPTWTIPSEKNPPPDCTWGTTDQPVSLGHLNFMGTVPAQVTAGTAVDIQLGVDVWIPGCNEMIPDWAVSEHVQVSFFLSTTPQLDSSAVSAGSLDASGYATCCGVMIDTSFVVPADLAPGTYYLIAKDLNAADDPSHLGVSNAVTVVD